MINGEKFIKEKPIIDAHCHIFPPNIFNKIWQYFDEHYWYVKYKFYGEQIAEFYRKRGIERFTTLNYAHKPGIAERMNEYVRNFHKKHPESIPLGTIHPGDKKKERIIQTILSSYDFKGIKLQLLVTDFFITDKRLNQVFEIIEQEDKILVVHAGTGPLPNEYVGIKYFRKFLKKHPNMKIQVAHLGCYQYKQFFQLLDDYENVYLDSAMILVDHNVFDAKFNLDPHKLLEYEDRLLFGVDFPNIPYNFKKSYDNLFKFDFPQEFYEKLFYKNARNFYNL